MQVRRSLARTMLEAHRHVAAHWNELQSGDVVDVEFILGETAAPKVSERVDAERQRNAAHQGAHSAEEEEQ